MEQLRRILRGIDRKGYKAYKALQGSYRFPDFTLYVDYVQGDPFAAPSRMRLRVAQSQARFPEAWYATHERRVALQDELTRAFARAISHLDERVGGSGKSGMILIDTPGQEVLERTSMIVNADYVEARVSVGLPAAGRTVLGKQAEQLLCEQIPELVRQVLFANRHQPEKMEQVMRLADDQAAIRRALKDNGWVAFIADGSVLPRESGVSDRPLKGGKVIPFESPPSMAVTIDLGGGRRLTGMAIPEGVTLIVGGGYHGKSTLLKAIERGVYNHVAGDGREYCITRETAVKVRAEDGRRVEKVNISPFINHLPFGQDTRSFSSEDASGSTSQAANIIEALEVGAEALLIDEDTSATNFMIRDGRMQALVAKGKEPITPFIDKVRQLYQEHRVSTVLVIGGSGDYFDVADKVIMMDEYRVFDVTDEAKRISREISSLRRPEGGETFGELQPRVVSAKSFQAQRGKREKVDAKGLHRIIYGTTEVDLSFVEQLVDPSQTRAIAQIMRVLEKNGGDNRLSLNEVLDRVLQAIRENGLDVISPYAGQHPGDLALPRKMEIAAAINRLRTLIIKTNETGKSYRGD